MFNNLSKHLVKNCGSHLRAFTMLNVPLYQTSYSSVKSSFQQHQNFQISQEGTIALEKKGIKQLFPIQIQTFEILNEGQDLIASDRTGSGKTIAFSLPIIQRFRKQKLFKKSPGVKFLILEPTRELAIQVQNQVNSLKRYPYQFSNIAVYGGSSMSRQIEMIKRGCDVVAATPGRLIDFIDQGVITLEDLQAVCIDEADFMMEIGFQKSVQYIFQRISQQVKSKPQIMLFSATMPQWVVNLSNSYMNKDKKMISLIKEEENQTSKTVRHSFLEVDDDSKQELLNKIISTTGKDRVIIFTKTKAEASKLGMILDNENVVLHSDIKQFDRSQRLRSFRSGDVKILIATDVAARGLDIPDVELVVQLQLPQTLSPYIHRSGRTGRVGKKGRSITFIQSSQQKTTMKEYAKKAKIELRQIKLIETEDESYELEEGKIQSLETKFYNRQRKGFSNQKLFKREKRTDTF